MGNKKNIIFIATSLGVVVCLLGVLIAIFHYRVLDNNNNSLIVSSKFLKHTDPIKVDLVTDVEENDSTSNESTVSGEISNIKVVDAGGIAVNDGLTFESSVSGIKDSTAKDGIVAIKNNDKSGVSMGADFHANGEYISDEEYLYRLSLIKNLRIKTVVVDSLTKGNGIAQEFYRTVFLSEMIPAKVLEPLVESRQFRELIPKEKLESELKVSLKKGEKIIFKNTDIKDLLVLWSHGKLVPYQKAWITKADKKIEQ